MSVLGTDLALEAAQAQLKTLRLTSQPGLTVRRRVRDGYALTAMDLTGPQQAEKLKRPMGKYITMELTPYLQRQQDFFARGARCIARELAALLPEFRLVGEHSLTEGMAVFAPIYKVLGKLPAVRNISNKIIVLEKE